MVFGILWLLRGQPLLDLYDLYIIKILDTWTWLLLSLFLDYFEPSLSPSPYFLVIFDHLSKVVIIDDYFRLQLRMSLLGEAIL
jgi:hypothetical protein